MKLGFSNTILKLRCSPVLENFRFIKNKKSSNEQIKIKGRSYSKGQYDPNWVIEKIKRAVDFMNMGNLQKYNFPCRMIEVLLSI
jgi:hypothetical protein